MRLMLLAVAACALSLAACSPPSQVETADPEPAMTAPAAAIAVGEPWAGATPDGAKTAAGYMTVTNSGAEPDRLLSAASPRAKVVEIHEMAMDAGMMTMRPLAGGIEVPAGGSVTLEPGGLHLMFLEITEGFAEGQEIPVTLTFEKAGAVEAALPVRKREDHGAH